MPYVPVSWLVVHAALDLALGLALLFLSRRDGRPVPAPPGARRTPVALALVAAASWVQMLVLRAFGLNFFGRIHLAFVDLLVVAPCLGLALVVAGRAGGSPVDRRARVILGAVLLAAGGAAAWGHWVEPFRLQVETPVVRAGRLAGPIRIGILADIQTGAVGDYERRAVDALVAAKPDIILVPGDLFQGTDAEMEATLVDMRALLSRLQAPLGAYVVIGNTDRPRRFRRAIEGTGLRWLHNRIVRLPTPAGEIVLGGVGYTQDAQLERVHAEVGSASGPGVLGVVMGHEPGALYRLGAERPPDLVVAGHTHGGQVQLPFFGALVTLSRLPARYASGLHRVDGSWLYVSRGVGVERGQAPRVRFLCPPEVTVLTVEPAGNTNPSYL